MLASFLHADPSLALATDQYELTMAYAYWKNEMAAREAEFYMYFRRAPFGGAFVVTAGLAAVIEALENFRFASRDVDYLGTLRDRAGQPLFEAGFLRHLAGLRFSCDVSAVPEGTVVFPHEPLLRVRGPILEAQVLETLVLNALNFQSLVATKAARVCLAAQGDPVLDFGLRRAQGLDGGFSASRACYIGGCVGTSNVLAGKHLGIPVLGTHAHSWVMAFDDEEAAFEAFARAMPNNCVFLVDTYDTLAGIRHAIAAGLRLRARGHHMVGLRLDSGDLAQLSRTAREMLDAAGLHGAVVMASGDLDEYAIAELKGRGACIGAWGVGTRLVTAYDEPALSGVYKLSAIRDAAGIAWQYKLKVSEQRDKTSLPGLLQVHRCTDAQGRFAADVVADVGEDAAAIAHICAPDGNGRTALNGAFRREPLLVPVFAQGRRVYDPPPLEAIRERVHSQLAALGEEHKRLAQPEPYAVGLSPRLHALREHLIRQARGPAPAPA